DDLKYHEETDISELRKGLLKKGDLLLNSTGTGTLGRALLFNLDRVCIADSHVTIVRCNRKLMIPSFLRLLVETPLYQSKILNELVAGSTNQIELSREELRNLIIPLPADEEQQWIVRGITEKTVEIDALISKKQLLIELLKEKRAAIISRAVTKGLDPNAPMKDSGIEWIGEIPEGWKVTKLKWLSMEPLKYGLNEPASESNQNDPRYVRITDITDEGILRDDTFKSIPQDVAKGYLLEEGDLLFARSGATVGKTFIYNHSWGVGCFAGYLIRFRADASKVSARYLYYFTKSSAYWNWLNSSFTKSTIQNASADKYKSLPVSVPNIESQREILNFLDESSKRIDSFISKIEKTIELLKEYRSALITAAVTGKIDVREEVP
ncbi:restriction endonuclease subunit S, partial [Mesotoga sp.]|uniref:restriction endonuclease subunit S n=1 Tax=Mesotoga sp. TaxID=2053577 RepID=UPI00345EB26B